MITPMLAASGPLPSDSAKWAYEVKWDGFRALVQASPGGVTITSRNGYNMTSRYPELDGLSRAISTRVLLDGEIVALNADGKPDFAALWFRSRGSADPEVRLCFMAFDVLELGGKGLIDRSWSPPFGPSLPHARPGRSCSATPGRTSCSLPRAPQRPRGALHRRAQLVHTRHAHT